MVLVDERFMVVCDTDEGACSRERFVLLGVALAPQIIVSSANGHGVSEDTCESRTSVERLLATLLASGSSPPLGNLMSDCTHAMSATGFTRSPSTMSAPLSPPTSSPSPSAPRRFGMHALVSWLRFISLRPPLVTRRSLKRPRQYQSARSLPAIVLQTYSASTEGIVLTALPAAPFCCHEDLLTMPRDQLEGVVRAFNEKLPRRMQISLDDGVGWMGCDGDDGEGEADHAISRMSDTEMRSWVEELVGIRRADDVCLSALDLGTGVGMDVSPSASPVPSPEPTPALADVHTDVDGNGGGADGTSFGVDAGLHDKQEDLREDTVRLTPPMRARTYSHPRGRGNSTVPLAALKEENEPQEEHVGGEALSDNDNVDEGEHEDREQPGDAMHVAKRRRVSFTRNEGVSPISRRVPTPQGSRLLEDLDISASPTFDWDEDDRDSRGRPSSKSAISASPRNANKQKRPANKLRRRRSARVPDRERVESHPPASASTFAPDTRPVSFPPCRFSIRSSGSRSSSRSCEAPLLTGPSPTASPNPRSSEHDCKR